MVKLPGITIKRQNKVIITDYESEGNKILSMRQIIFEYPG